MFIIVFFYVSLPTIIIPDYDYSEPTSLATSDRMHRTDTMAGCEVIHVAVVVRGLLSSNYAALLIKSILLFRQNPISFHFLVNLPAKHILSTLLRTWHLYGVEYTFWTESVKNLNGNRLHYSSFSYLMEVLPLSIERVILFEPTVLVSADIHELWKSFTDMKEQWRMFGVPMTEGEEFNSDMVLLDLESMREKSWLPEREGKTLSESTNSRSNVSKILSYMYKQDKTLFFPLSPGWSAHYQTHTPCYEQQTVCAQSSVGSSDFKTLIQEYDGNLLREKWIDCQTGLTFDENAMNYRAKQSVYAPPCTDFKREGGQERRTHPFYAGAYSNPTVSTADDVTLLLHTTLDRLIPMLEPMCQHWEGPMSITVFANDSEVSNLLDLIWSLPSPRQNIAYHIVYKEGVHMYYPANLLRLVALENAQTSQVFFNDIDFLPSFGLYAHLRQTVTEFNLSHAVLVVPAFETHSDPHDFIFPQSKSALLEMVAENVVFQFHRDEYIRGHAPTDYTRWAKAREVYEIQWQPHYEPYLVTSRNITPLDTRFVGRDFDKVSHIELLYYQRYKFYVMPDVFILHLPHALSSDAKKEKVNERYRDCYRRRRDKWRVEMAQEYGYEPYLVNVYKIWNRLSSSYETSF